MITEENNNQLLKISSEKLIYNLEKRGNIYDETLKKNMYDLEKEYKNNIDSINRSSLYEKYNIPTDIISVIDLLQLLDDYNINYINFVLIYHNLDIQQLKNFYRYIMIKWNKIKNNLNVDGQNHDTLDKINNFTFQDIMLQINEAHNYNIINDLIINKIKDFIYLDDNKFPNIYIIFFINTLQEYIYPM